MKHTVCYSLKNQPRRYKNGNAVKRKIQETLPMIAYTCEIYINEFRISLEKCRYKVTKILLVSLQTHLKYRVN
jgi:hypothetical protein